MGQISRKRDYDDAGLAAESTPSKRNRQPPPSIGIHEMNGSQEHGDTITSTSVSGDSTGPTNDSSSGISEGSIDHDVFPDDDEDRTSSSSSSSSSSEEGRSSADLSEDENDGGKSSVGDSSEVYKANDSDSESEPARGEDDDPITFVSHRPKPQFQRVNESSLFSRVSSFLPRLRAANEDLERQITSGLAQDVIMNDIDDGNQGQYIEMVCTHRSSRLLIPNSQRFY